MSRDHDRNAPTGRELWRSLDELAQSPDFEEVLANEFPRQAASWPEGVSRRRFLELSAASLALGGLAGCTRQPLEKIVPFVEQPEQIVPGRPLYFATATELGGYATPVLAESHLGRPTKLEGNAEHPASTGATDLFTQAEVLTLYDPDRSQVVTHNGRIRSWPAFRSEFRSAVQARQALGAERMRVLTGTVTSPALTAQIERLLSELPEARWHQWEPAHRDAALAGAELAFGRPLEAHYDLSRADRVVGLDTDFLTSGPGHLSWARQFADRRRIRGEHSDLSRFYAVESSPTATGTMADHRIPVRPSEVGAFARALAAELGLVAGGELGGSLATWVATVAADLEAHRGSSLVVAGDYADANVHALAHALNAALGNVGSTVTYHEPTRARAQSQAQSITELVAAMEAGEVDSLLILGGNPVYDAPSELNFVQAMYKVPRRVHLGLYADETAELCHWHVPAAHPLESWGDSRTFDGTVTLMQPLIEPLYGGKTALEVVAALLDEEERSGDEILREFWAARLGDADFEAAWRQCLHDGFVADTAEAAVDAPIVAGAAQSAAAALADAGSDGLEVALRPDPTVWDGRFANNGWLQECPKPLTKLTWDNAAVVGPAMAQRLGLANEQMVRVSAGERTLEAPVWIQPGHPDQLVTLHLGYGRRRAGRIGNDAGVDAYALRTAATPWTVTGASLVPGTGTRALASTQLHSNIEQETEESGSRHLVRVATQDEFHHHPDFAQHMEHVPGPEMSLFPPFEYNGYAWGLAVDLNSCTGCNACVVACQSENNIPVVGKEQVLLGREMQWIRIDRYFDGDLEDPAVHHQPVMCMHCENAPCELVCPVSATVHSDEGLNDMVYNRCVGTRYCANNCPYKVRRFNFFLYQDFETPVLDLLRNPDVTVRSRGVMEKCTYCVQRINGARIDAKREGRKIADGEIQTACQQVCPTRAIVFGDINDETAEVTRLKGEPRNYGILEEVNTRPRTSYLAKITNPGGESSNADHDSEGHGS